VHFPILEEDKEYLFIFYWLRITIIQCGYFGLRYVNKLVILSLISISSLQNVQFFIRMCHDIPSTIPINKPIGKVTYLLLGRVYKKG
jgi:hypothetical protein